MRIKKYAHACLLVEKDGTKIIIDPGSWNELPDEIGVSALLITHEHMDHFDTDQVKGIVANNPDIRVISHPVVGEKLAALDIKHESIEPHQTIDVNGLTIESFGKEHQAIYKMSPCRNTGFLIAEELFVPGDALHDVPDKPVRILALPTGGPWMKLADAIDYAKQVEPAIIFPVHDAMYVDGYQRGLIPNVISSQLEGMQFIDLPAGTEREF